MSSNSTDVASPAAPKPLFGSCWGCRVLSGMALIGSGFWIYLGPRRVMQQRIPPNMWHITQMFVAISVAVWGIVLITNPVGKLKPKED
ncbi:distal membrane-arm assembly complex protein 1-like [Heteronotia binoei]|uniref:distal membrane-arm assembly complex protein 1-like n=1 Tax=Heteronotia binoei TaxID=13085 RepID=UPI00292CF82B|nr:distal membrane-arm assembly complex protein 1-like [Heteronotia binoei]